MRTELNNKATENAFEIVRQLRENGLDLTVNQVNNLVMENIVAVEIAQTITITVKENPPEADPKHTPKRRIIIKQSKFLARL